MENLADRYRIICIPFVDYDGAIDGDQGKNRNGKDHNRDYDAGETPIYSTTAKIREFAKQLHICYAIDFHSPWHWQGTNDTVFIPVPCFEMVENVQQFSALFEKEITPNALPYQAKNNMMPNEDWNKVGTYSFSSFWSRNGASLAFTLETAYFKASDTMFSEGRAVSLGKCFAKALEKYID